MHRVPVQRYVQYNKHALVLEKLSREFAVRFDRLDKKNEIDETSL